jgi:hypothetical protein
VFLQSEGQLSADTPVWRIQIGSPDAESLKAAQLSLLPISRLYVPTLAIAAGTSCAFLAPETTVSNMT